MCYFKANSTKRCVDIMKFKYIKKYITFVFGGLCIIPFCVACSSNKPSASLLAKPMSAYGSETTIETAVNKLFNEPSWGLGSGKVDSNGLTTTVLSGNDQNGDRWVINFYSDTDDPNEWYAEVTEFSTSNYYASFLDEYGSDLLMRYLATGDELYRYVFLDIYSCGDKIEKSYDILDLYKTLGIIPADNAEEFINKYDELFPSVLNSLDVTCYLPAELINWDTNVDDVRKNLDRYGGKLFPISNLTVSDIMEETVSEDQYLTQVSAHDNNLQFYHILYCGELVDIHIGDTISALVLPIAEGTLDNGLGGNTEYLYLLACSALEGANLDEIYYSIADPQRRYELALDWVEMSHAQEALYEESDFDMSSIPDSSNSKDEQVETSSFIYNENSPSYSYGYEQGYNDGWSNIDYNDNPALSTNLVENSEEYIAGYEHGYMAGRYNAVNR